MGIAMRLGLIALAAAADGCSRPKELRVDGAWVRLPAVHAQPGAAYFTIHGGATDTVLIDAGTDVAVRSEMHADMAGGMKRVASLAVPAGGTVAFAPGGRHVMLWDLNQSAKPGATITLRLTFADGERLLADAPVLDAGAPALRF